MKVGSSKWQAKNGEELVLNLGYGNSDLAFQMDTDLIAAGSITSELDLSYSFGDFLIGGGATLVSAAAALVAVEHSMLRSELACGVNI